MNEINIRRTKVGLGDIICSLAVIEHIKKLNPKKQIKVFTRYQTLHKCVPYAEMLPIQLAPEDCLEISSDKIFEKTLQEAYFDSIMQQLGWDEKYAGQIQKLYPSEIEIKSGIGVFLRSAQTYRSYPYMFQLIQQLQKIYPVYVFDDAERVEGAINLININLDTLVSLVSQMLLIVSPDTAGIHIAGATGVPVFGVFGATDPHKRITMYPNSNYIYYPCKYQPCWNAPKCISCDDYTWCMKNLKVEEILTKIINLIPIKRQKPLPKQTDGDCAVVRMRGLGDVLMCWFALEALTKTGAKIDFYTSPEAEKLFYGQNSSLVHRVIPIDYKHHALNAPVDLPKVILNKKYKRIYNLMNAVDFGENAYKQARAKNFADLLGVDIKGISLRKICIPDDMKVYAQAFGKYICIQTDADGTRRQYPIPYWQKVVKLLSKQLPEDFRVVLVGRKNVNISGHRCINLTGKTNIEQYIALVCYSELFIGTDSSGIHIRARSSYKTDMIVLLGNTGKSLDGEFAHLYLYDLTRIHIIEAKKCAKRPCWDIGKCKKSCLYEIKPKKIVKEVIRNVSKVWAC